MNHTQTYIDAVIAKHSQGGATEHTYRPPMENYLHALLQGVEATNEKQRQACGMPDFVLTITRKGQPIDIGYIEAKDIGVSLDKTEKSDQMKRYLASLDNLILTDYLEFRFYREQKKVATVSIAELQNGSIKALPDNFAQLENLLSNFVEYTGQTIKSAKTLASMMARKAQLMRDVFETALEDEQSSLHKQFLAFQKILIHDMNAAQFADVYAQTIAFGLFTARLHDKTLEDFSRAEARDLIPRSNPFLRQLFDYVCGADLDPKVVWIVDALCEVYRATNVHEILHSFGKQSGRNDPVVHFYEDFLAEYDPKLRKARGVWYTPEPVVNFIVRGVDHVLQEHFGLADGIADTSKVTIEVDDQAFDKRTKSGKAKTTREVHRVQLLDVAAGTGTFTAEAIKQIYQKICDMGMKGSWNDYVEQHLLPRLHGFEILMASYAMCHLKIDMLLSELGYTPSSEYTPPRLGVYLTNALEEHHPDTDSLFASWLASEANEANRIKRDMPIMVAYGNPPYSGESANKGEHIMSLMEAYKKEPGGKEKLKEKNSKYINDDYVKFIRLAENYIERNGDGVLAFITSHGYLDNPTFRGMRWHLLKTFDDIYIMDLHGNAKKKEIAPDGSPDVNVFDIQAGVSIIIAVKHGKRKSELAELHHADLWGSRKLKYDTLWDGDLKALVKDKLLAAAPNYFFVKKNYELERSYNKGFSATDLFDVYSLGTLTKRDRLSIADSREHLVARFEEFTNPELPDEQVAERFNLKMRDNDCWDLKKARHSLLKADLNDFCRLEWFRPFEKKWIMYHAEVVARLNTKVFDNFNHESNVGLVLVRQLASLPFHHALITNDLSDQHYLSTRTKEGGVVLPLYLYPDTTSDQGSLDDAAGANAPKRSPNLDDKIVAQIADKLGIPFVPDHEDKAADDHSCFSPLDLLDYIYAVLHSPTYRDIYKEFLKIDFPRIPYPDDTATFFKLAALGGELRQIHLLEHPIVNKAITQFCGSGDNSVTVTGKQSYRDGRVYLNDEQYFEGVPELAWNFYIGGYQPAQKWLKDRKDRKLNFDDIRHYQKIIVALTNTDRLMKEIDEVWKP